MRLHVILLVLASLSCQKLRHEQVNIASYPDISELMESQVEMLGEMQLIKTVTLEGASETDTFQMDASRWRKELAFLLEANPNQPEYVGVFEVTESEREVEMEMKMGENGILKNLRLTKPVEGFWSLYAIIHEDKDVYSHHREVAVSFKDDLLDAFEIKGYQKLMFKDTVWFGIEGNLK